MKDEALKLAKSWFEANTYGDEAVEVYEAIKQALAAPPAPVQPVASLKKADVLMMAESHGIDPNTKGLYGFYIDCISNHPVARPAVQEPVALLANGTRFKISYDSRQSGGQIHGIPPELGGRWVAFVAADDDCHLKLTTPPAAQRQWVGLTDEERDDISEDWATDVLLDIFEVISAIEAKLRSKNGY
jgi:hypothetical protein